MSVLLGVNVGGYCILRISLQWSWKAALGIDNILVLMEFISVATDMQYGYPPILIPRVRSL